MGKSINTMDKEQTSFSDTIDAFRLALAFYKRSKG
jgi:hypothetical protein